MRALMHSLALPGPHSSSLPASMCTDSNDMIAIGEGDERAFRRVVERHQHSIAAYCIRLLASKTEAQDVTQDVFLTLWRERKRYKEKSKLRFYLLKIARFRCLAQLKKRKASLRLSDKVRDSYVGNTRQAASSDEPALHIAISSLIPKHRDILILRYMEELNLSEIKTLTGLRLGTIKSRLNRAMIALRAELNHAE